MMDAFLKRHLAMTMNHGVQQEHPHCAKKGVCDEDCEYMRNFKE